MKNDLWKNFLQVYVVYLLVDVNCCTSNRGLWIILANAVETRDLILVIFGPTCFIDKYYIRFYLGCFYFKSNLVIR